MIHMIQRAKDQAAELAMSAYRKAVSDGVLPEAEIAKAPVEIPKDTKNGDFTTTFALAASKALHQPPRTIAQAEALDKAGIVFDAVINLEISDEEILQRMSGRRVCEKCGASYHVVAIPPKVEGVCDACGGTLVQRADDAPKTVASRLEVYHRETEPLKEYYAKKGNLKEIFNQATVEGTTQKILEALGQNV